MPACLSVGTDLNLGAAPTAATAGKLVVNSGTLLASANFTLSSNRGIALGPSSGSGSGEIDAAPGIALTYGGIIANNGGTGCLTVGSGSNTGTLALSGTNTYSGTTTINASTLSVSTDLNLGAAPTAATAGKLVINSGTLLASGNFTLNANRGIAVGPSSGTGPGEIDVAAGKVLTYAGIIANQTGGTGCLTVGSGSNTGTLALSGSNTYSGGTTVNAGTIIVLNTSSLGTNTVTESGGTVSLQGAGVPTGVPTIGVRFKGTDTSTWTTTTSAGVVPMTNWNNETDLRAASDTELQRHRRRPQRCKHHLERDELFGRLPQRADWR